MTIVDPAASSPHIAIVRRQGRLIAGGLAGLFALAFCVWFFNSQYLARGDLNGQIRTLGTPGLIATATLASAFVTGWLWDKFVQNRRPFSWGWSVAAGVLAVVLADLLTWLAVLSYGVVWSMLFPAADDGLAAAKLGPIGTVAVRGVSALLATSFGVLFLAPFTIIVTGVFTIPLAIVACLAATAWCRRRLRDEGLASYASPKPPAKP